MMNGQKNIKSYSKSKLHVECKIVVPVITAAK